jgi:LPPG:FO 2-phospho-L-lactate transferase
MITILSGGTGTPKLIQGMSKIVRGGELSIIVNTAEDHWLAHGFISPDVDTVVYTLAGIVDDTRWHGIKGDTYHTHVELVKLGSSEYLRIGDLDRAIHIWRGELLKKGEKLSRIIERFCQSLKVKASVMPMSDNTVKSIIECKEGEMDLHEFWVKRGGKPNVNGVRYSGLKEAKALHEAVNSIEKAEKVIIGPSNPVTSIYPIIGFEDMREALIKNRAKVIAVSPIIGNNAFSGPAEKMMKAAGIEGSVKGIAGFYKEMISHLIVDRCERFDSMREIEIHKTDILLNNMKKRVALAKYITDI